MSQPLTLASFLGFEEHSEFGVRDVDEEGNIFPENKWASAAVAYALVAGAIFLASLIFWIFGKCIRCCHKKYLQTGIYVPAVAEREEQADAVITNDDFIGKATRTAHIISILLWVLIVSTGVYFAFFVRGVSVWNFLVGAGVLSLIMSYGAGSTLPQLLPAISIYMSGVYQLGDVITFSSSLGVITGRIMYIGWGHTSLKLEKPGTVFIVPTSSLKAMQTVKHAKGTRLVGKDFL